MNYQETLAYLDSLGNLAFVWEWNVLKDYCGN